MGESADLAKRRSAAALAVVGAHVAAFLLMRAGLLHPRPTVETPEFVSIGLPASSTSTSSNATNGSTPGTAGAARTSRAATKAKRATRARRGKAGSTERSNGVQPEQTPQPIESHPPIDWLADAEFAARDEIASDIEKRRRAEWLLRGADPETHPLIQALKPMYPKMPEFGWDHARIHRVEHVQGGPLIVWINDRCALAFLGLAVLPVCQIGHMEPNGALFEHIHDPGPPPVPNPLP